MFCKNCGNEAGENMKFCINCGSELSPPEEQQAPDNAYTQIPEPQNAPEQPPIESPMEPLQYAPEQPPIEPPIEPLQNTPEPPPFQQPQYAPPEQFQPHNITVHGQHTRPQKKGTSTVLVVTATVIAIAAIIGGMFLYMFRDSIFGGASSTPAPSRGGTVTVNPGGSNATQPGDSSWRGAELEGSWVNGEGDFIYYFYQSESIRFTITGDGEGRVHEDQWNEWADWWIDANGFLHIVGDDTDDHDIFQFHIIGNVITLIDEDGDMRAYTKS